jgi:hypothetical protein
VPGGKVRILFTGLGAYFVSLLILLLILYSHERAKAGPLGRRVVLVMTQMASLFALAPATIYVLLTELLKRHR